MSIVDSHGCYATWCQLGNKLVLSWYQFGINDFGATCLSMVYSSSSSTYLALGIWDSSSSLSNS